MAGKKYELNKDSVKSFINDTFKDVKRVKSKVEQAIRTRRTSFKEYVDDEQADVSDFNNFNKVENDSFKILGALIAEETKIASLLSKFTLEEMKNKVQEVEDNELIISDAELAALPPSMYEKIKAEMDAQLNEIEVYKR